jgi:hypothetical protein
MNEEFARQTQAFLSNVANTRVPAEVQAIAQDGVAKARETFTTWSAAAQSGTKAIDEVVQVSWAGAKSIGDELLSNAQAAAEAAFDTAQQMARAKTLPEAAQLQAKFVQEQLANASQQGKGLFELSAKIAQKTTNALTAIATKAAGDLKKVGA